MRKFLFVVGGILLCIFIGELILLFLFFYKNTSKNTSGEDLPPSLVITQAPVRQVDSIKIKMGVIDPAVGLRFGPDVFQGDIGGLTVFSDQDVRPGVVEYVLWRSLPMNKVNKFRVNIAYGDPEGWARYLNEKPKFTAGSLAHLTIFGLRSLEDLSELPENYRFIFESLEVGVREKLEAYFLEGTIPPEWQEFVDEEGILDLRHLAAGIYMKGAE